MNAINIDFSTAITDLQRICMESLDLSYKFVDLKIKSKAPDQIYFVFQNFQNHNHYYDNRYKYRKMKIIEIYLFLLPPLPSQDRGGGL